MTRSATARSRGEWLPVLTATPRTQGYRSNDFCFTTASEIVMFGSECDGESIDGSCGCRRSLVGLDSLKSTTTFLVARLPLSRQELLAKFTPSLRRSGWLKLMPPDMVQKLVDLNLDVASDF